MRRLRRSALALAVSVALGSSCVASRDEMVSPVDAAASARLGKRVAWYGSNDERDAAVAASVARLKGALNLATVVDVALVAQPSLQASYASLGLAQADLVDAGLLDNPRVALSTVFDVNNGSPGLEADVELPFLNILLAAQQTSMQRALRDANVARVVDDVLSVAGEARRAFVRAVSARELSALAKDDVAAAEVAVLYVRANVGAGNMTAYDLAAEEAAFEEARVAALGADADVAVADAGLAVAVGLKDAASLALPPSLPPLPPSPDDAPPGDGIVARVVEKNVSLAARRAALDGLAQSLGIASAARFLPDLDVGVRVDAAEDATAVGPTLGFTVPLLDLGQGEVLRRESRLRREGALLVGDQLRLQGVTRTSLAAVDARRRQVRAFDDVVLPARDHVVDELERRLNGMLNTPRDLAVGHRARVAARRQRAIAARDAWLAFVDVEQLLQGGTPPMAMMSSTSSTSSSSTQNPAGHD